MPVTTVDGGPVGDGAVGPITRRLMTLFEAYFAEALAPSIAGDPPAGQWIQSPVTGICGLG